MAVKLLHAAKRTKKTHKGDRTLTEVWTLQSMMCKDPNKSRTPPP